MDKSLKKVRELFRKYKDEPHMIEKLTFSICYKLPLEAICWQKDDKHKKNYEEEFIENFMTSDVQYFYIKKSDIFIKYDCVNYCTINEDDLWHTILCEISKNEKILSNKQTIKDNIIEKIKKTKLDSGIPESKTIQKIINSFYPLFLKTKTEAKYFLCILGDNILKKQYGENYLVPPTCRSFFDHILDCYKDYFNNKNIIESFIFNNYDENNYDKYRIIDFNSITEDNHYWKYFINENILDLVFVAMHYSSRYDNAENFLKGKIENKEKILFLQGKKDDDILKQFIHSNLMKKENSVINTNELYYLWKQYVMNKNIPGLFTLQKFTMKIREFKHSNDLSGNNDNILGLYSDELKIVRRFLQFWDKQIKLDADDELELSEIFYLFKQKSKIKTTSERELSNIIKHFFTFVKISNNKKICGYKCDLWNKKQSVYNALSRLNIQVSNIKKISPIHLYKNYCNLLKEEGEKERVVSKQYFMDYIY